MLNRDDIKTENNKKHNKKWPFILDHLHRILLIAGSESGKTNSLLNLLNKQDGIDKTYLYTKHLREPKYEFLIKKREDASIKHFNDLNTFIEFSNTLHAVYGSIDDYT